MHKLLGNRGYFHGLKHLRTVLLNLRTSLQCDYGVLHSRHRRRCQRCQSVQGEQRQTAVGGRARQRGRQGEHFSGMPSSVRPSASAFGKDALARQPSFAPFHQKRRKRDAPRVHGPKRVAVALDPKWQKDTSQIQSLGPKWATLFRRVSELRHVK